MKLKKIASLALAGVMAVSMLAGCATTKPETKPEEPTETSSLSKEVGDEVAKLVAPNTVPNYVKFEDSDSLTKALQRGVEAAGVDAITTGYVTFKTLQNASTVYDAAGFKRDVNTVADLGSQAELVKAETEAAGKDTVPNDYFYATFVISTAVGENELKAQIAKQLMDVAEYQYTVKKDSSVQENANFNFNYVVSVSTCTKSANSAFTGGNGAANPSVTYVAIQIVRTGTHQ